MWDDKLMLTGLLHSCFYILPLLCKEALPSYLHHRDRLCPHPCRPCHLSLGSPSCQLSPESQVHQEGREARGDPAGCTSAGGPPAALPWQSPQGCGWPRRAQSRGGGRQKSWHSLEKRDGGSADACGNPCVGAARCPLPGLCENGAQMRSFLLAGWGSFLFWCVLSYLFAPLCPLLILLFPPGAEQ